MTDDPVALDQHRGLGAQKATELRRQQQHDYQADQAVLRRRQEDLEGQLLAAPAETWPDAAAKARYLIGLFAASPEALDPRLKKLIAHALEDLDRLCARDRETT